MQLALLCFLIFVIVILAYSMLFGAPYAPLGEHKTQALIDLLKKPGNGKRAVDLGAGDGRIVIALAKHGFESHGFEFNPLLVYIARHHINKAGLSGKAFMHWGDMWRVDLARYDVITIYLTARIMKRMEQKIQKETKPGTKIVVNYFKLPNRKFAEQKDTLYLYKI
jgi:ribosomal protein L11 methylase PrmA